MGKNATLKNSQGQEFEEYDFDEMLMGASEEGAMLEMLGSIAAIDREQSQLSFDLTKLIVENATDSKLKEKEILSTFKKAKQMVLSCSPLQEIFQKMSS